MSINIYVVIRFIITVLGMMMIGEGVNRLSRRREETALWLSVTLIILGLIFIVVLAFGILKNLA